MIDSPAILIDTTRCNGCETCILACKQENDLGSDRLRHGQQAVDGLSSTRFSTILRRSEGRFVRHMCRHCLEPACASVCIVGALQKSPEGPVVYDSSLCIGCRYCLMACPYGVPRYEWEEAAPYVRKCTMCHTRLKASKQPACVEACPQQALCFGSREDLLVEARNRIQARSGDYVPHVYGEKEVGGTSVLYVSSFPLDFLAMGRGVGEEPLPELTWVSLKKVPSLVLLMGGLMGGIHWVIRRRMLLAADTGGVEGEQGPEPGPPESAAGGGGEDD